MIGTTDNMRELTLEELRQPANLFGKRFLIAVEMVASKNAAQKEAQLSFQTKPA